MAGSGSATCTAGSRAPVHSPSLPSDLSPPSLCHQLRAALACLLWLILVLPLVIPTVRLSHPSSPSPSSPPWRWPLSLLPSLLPTSAQTSYQDNPLFWSWSGGANLTLTTMGGGTISILGDEFLAAGVCSKPPVITFTFSNGSSALCQLTYQDNTHLQCTVPPGTGRPHVTLTVCGLLNRDLPRMPTDMVYYVGQTPPMSAAWCGQWNNSQVLGFTSSNTTNWMCTSDSRQKMLATGNQTPDRPLFTFCSPSYAGSAANCTAMAAAKRCINISDPAAPTAWVYQGVSYMFCTELASPYYFTFVPNCVSAGNCAQCQSQCLQILNPYATSTTTFSSGNAYLCTTTYPSPFPAGDSQLVYHYQSPTITTFFPLHGPAAGGTVVTLVGSSFGWRSVASVTVLPSNSACNITFLNHTYATCTMPAGQGVAYLSMTVDSLTTSASMPFTYDPPQLQLLSPQNPDCMGGANLTISGLNFGSSGSVAVFIAIGSSLTASPCSPQYLYNNTMIVCAVPPGQGANQSVFVTSNMNVNTAPGLLSYLPPVVRAISPTTYDTAGGATLLINGTSFGTAGSVTVGGVACQQTGIGYTNTAIQCGLPAGQGLYQQVVVTASGQSSSPSGVFNYSAPTITSVAPQGGTGSALLITIKGTAFGNSSNSGVYVGGQVCTVASLQWQNTRIVCTVPPSSGLLNPVYVNVSGQLSNVSYFSFSPSISTVSAPDAPTQGGALVSITGAGFSVPAMANITIYMGSAICPVLNQTSTGVNCTLPPGAGTVSVIASLAGLNSTAVSFSYDPPSLRAIVPSTGGPTLGGNILTITGSNFGTSPTATVGSAACNVTGTPNNTYMTCVVPPGSGSSNPVVVSAGGGLYTTSLTYAYFAPILYSITPISGASAGGSNLTLVGSNFSQVTASTTVIINSASLTPLYQNDSMLVVLMPAYTTQPLVYPSVLVNGLSSSSPQPVVFTYDGASISLVLPASAGTDGGTLMKINGTNFGSTGYVLFGSTQATLVAGRYSNTYIECYSPAGQGSAPVTVTVGNVRSAIAYPWAYLPPSIAAITPTSMPTSGGLVTLQGSNFGKSGVISFGSFACSTSQPSTSYNSSRIVCQLAAGQGANLTVIVNVSAQSNSASTLYSYNPPCIGSINPASGPTSGQGVLTLLGSNFGLAAVTTFVNTSGNPQSLLCAPYGLGQSHTQILCTVPAYVGASVPIYVNVSGQVSPFFPYTYTAPVITGFNPASSPTQGGVQVTFTGSNFGSGLSFGAANYALTFASAAITGANVILVNHTSLVFLAPAGTGGGVSFSLTVGSQAAYYSGPLFTYQAPNLTRVSGCDNSSSTAAVNCPTGSPSTITVYGSNFGAVLALIQVTVGGVNCTGVVLATPHAVLICTLQSRAAGGFNLPVQVTVNGLYSTASLVSFAGPTIYAHSLIPATSTTSLAVVGTTGTGRVQMGVDGYPMPYNVTLSGQTWGNNASALQVLFGPAGWSTTAGSTVYQCAIYAATIAYDGVSRNSSLTCAVSSGVGSNLTFVVSSLPLSSQESTDMLSFPAPSIVAGTIRPNQTAAGGTELNGQSSQGDSVFFDVQHVGFDANLLSVYYSKGTGSTLICGQVLLYNTSTVGTSTISCLTAPGAGSGYHFQVFALNTFSELGSDVYNYVTAPIVYAVTGCAVNSTATNSTSGCKTVGGDTITILGSSFASKSSVTVNGLVCKNVVYSQANSTLTCSLPAQAGSSLPVIVSTGLTFSQAANLVSYASATITSISGCSYSFSSTIDCARDGGDVVTVQGANFGTGTPTVLVNGNACTSVAVNAAQSSLTCSTPPGTATLQPIIFIQNGGTLTIAPSSVYLSYHQCDVGSFAATGNTTCAACSAGTFANVAGLTSCLNCPTGSYASSSAATSCQSTQPGQFALAGASNYSLCPLGQYSAVSGASACTLCAAGQYSSSYASTNCSACSAGQYSASAGLSGCTQCSIGYYSTYAGAVQCLACPVGTFANCSVAGVSTCTSCPIGSYTSDPGQTQCSQCQPGSYGPTARLAACLACDAGTYTNTTGQTACSQCPAGSYSAKLGTQGATSCTLCPIGQYTEVAAQPECLQCGPGQANSLQGQTSCQLCTAGHYTSTLGQTTCSACPMGTFSAGNETVSCPACPVGTFGNTTGLTACYACPAGSVQSQAQQSVCTPCPLGTYMASVGQAACLACDPGSYANVTGLSACLTCPAGSACAPTSGSSVGTIQPSLCSAGSYSVGEQEACTQVAAGQFQNATGATSYLRCPAGQASSSTNAIACQPCTAGYYAPSDGALACLQCPLGSISTSDGAIACTACSTGSFSASAGSSICYSCSAGYYADQPGQAACLPCSAGSYSGSSASGCTPCGAGTYQANSGHSSCDPCGIGQAQSATGQVSCSPCPAGTFSSSTGSHACTSCPAGTSSSTAGVSACTNCSAGTYTSAVGQLVCVSCDVGTFNPSQGQTGCQSCATGFYGSSPSLTVCQQCQAGYHTGTTGTVQCYSCPPGSFTQANGSTACTPCSPGSYQASSGQSGCTFCPSGQYSTTENAVSCLTCPAGQVPLPYIVNGIAQGTTSCGNCAAGSYQPSPGGATCTPCAQGTYQGNTGQAACIPCPTGQYAPTNSSTSCSVCPTGTAQSQSGSISCSACTAGQYNNASSQSSCLNCAAGAYSSSAASLACTACGPGQYQPITGQQGCLPCPLGTFTAQNGSATCTHCAPGYFQNTTGQTACTACPIGQNQPQSGQSSCVDCAGGSFTDVTGQSSCTQCSPGHFQNSTGQTQCFDCEPGSAQGSNGGINCTLCDVGTVMPSTGFAACTPCPAGQYMDHEGGQYCDVCTAGHYSPVQGCMACSTCPNGTYQAFASQSTCVQCDLGTASNATGLTASQCDACPVGSYAGQPGQAACDLCLAGSFAPSEGLSACALCSTGTYQPNNGSEDCTACPLGYSQPSLGSLSCIPCDPGYYANSESLSNCLPCNAGQYIDTPGAQICSPCGEGHQQPMTGQTNCTVCDIGSYNPGEGVSTCYQCPAGRYQPSNNSIDCLSCPAGSYQDQTGASGCLLCPPGQFQQAPNQKQCIPAPAGYFTNTSGATAKVACPAGSYQPSNSQSTCLLCSPGTFQASEAMQQCDQCPAGHVTTVNGSIACTPCPTGFQQPTPGSTSCIPCAPGSSAGFQGTSRCEACEAGTFSNASQATSCYACDPGYQQPSNNATSCYQCLPGSAASSPATAVCPACAAGSVTPYFGQTSCALCPPQTAQISTGQEECSPCSPGTYNNNSQGLSSCTQCSPGSYTNDTGAALCTLCPLGEAQLAAGSTQCLPCTDGQVAPQMGLPACVDCPTGSFSVGEGQTGCINCPAGWYQGVVGQSVCFQCPVGTASNVSGVSSCNPCQAGYIAQDVGSLACEQCEPGYFQPSDGQEACFPCAHGTYYNGYGASVCQQCGYGQYADTLASLQCSDCPNGTYKDQLGDGECVACNPGEFNPAQGQQLCQVCPVGTHSDVSDATHCLPCEVGTSSDLVNQSSCAACTAGSYMANTGQTECQPCPIGFYSDSDGASICLGCPIGTYQDELGATSCILCPGGQTTPTPGLSYCTDCPTGQEANLTTKGSFCQDCPAGTYNVNTGVLACKDCPAGFYSTTGQQVCTACADLTVSASSGAAACVHCDSNSISNLEHTACLCNPGYYLPLTHVPGSSYFSCAVCPTGANCAGQGTTYATLGALPGWWRSGNDTLNFYQCPITSYCLGGLADGTTAANLADDGAATACAGNRGGILCSTCLTGYHEQPGGSCVLCPTGGTSWASVALIAVAVLFLVWLQIFIVIRSGKREITRGLSNQATAEGGGVLSAFDEDSEEDDDSDSSSDESSSEEDDSSEGSQVSSSGSDSRSRSSRSAASGRPSKASKKGSASSSLEDSSSRSGSSSGSTAGGDDTDETSEGETEGDAAEEDAASSEEEEDEEPMNPMEHVDPARINFHVRYGPPEPTQDFTYKLKIFLSFIQVATNLGANLNIVWPTLYVNFLLFFDVANFDFALSSVASADCISVVNYYNKYVAIILAPILILVLTVLFYLLPNYLEFGPFRGRTMQERQRGKMNFWRLFLYFLFLVYPSVSSTVLRLYVCKEIDNQYYLNTDLSVMCYTPQWTTYTYASLLLILLYPIGIPIFFFSILRVNQENLREPRIRAQLGFLYAGYRAECWWFEIAESIHKLTLTSILGFLPANAQLPTGMGVCCLYFLVMLTMNPYLSSFDDMLALYSECEMLLLITAGWIFYNQPVGTSQDNVLVSLCLIALTVFFFLAFLFAALYVVVTLAVRWKTKRRIDRQQREAADPNAQPKEVPLSPLQQALALKAKREFTFVPDLGDSDDEDEQRGTESSDKGRHEKDDLSQGEEGGDLDEDLDVGDDLAAKAGRRMRGKQAAEEEHKEQGAMEQPFAVEDTEDDPTAAIEQRKAPMPLSARHVHRAEVSLSEDEEDEEEEELDVFGLSLDDDVASPRNGQGGGGDDSERQGRRRGAERTREEVEKEEDDSLEDVIVPRVRREGEEEDIAKHMINIINQSQDT